jgi:hypothetical protein
MNIQCDCGSVIASTNNRVVTTGYCHCEDCREIRQTPFFPVVAWEGDDLNIVKGSEHLETFQHPKKRMKRVFCKHCGETVFSTNAMGWKIVSQPLIAKSNNGKLPAEYQSQAHFFYSHRIIDINDNLPKIG